MLRFFTLKKLRCNLKGSCGGLLFLEGVFDLAEIIPTDKPFTSYEEQLSLLESKGLCIGNHEHAIQFLKKSSYFSLINGYKEIFKIEHNGLGLYKTGLLFEDIVKLYEFDCELRSWLLRYVLVIERKLKSLISYYFSQKHQADKHFYLNKNNYKYSNENPKIDTSVKKLISVFQGNLESYQYRYINHYRENHNGDIPLWVIIGTLSLGKVSKLFELCLPGVQNKICLEYDSIKAREMVNMLMVLTKFRNVCAHNERLYDYRTNDVLENMNIHHHLGISKTREGTYTHGIKDLLSVLIVFRCLLDNDDFFNCFKHIDQIVSDFKFVTNVVTKTQVIQRMGFPPQWRNIASVDNR